MGKIKNPKLFSKVFGVDPKELKKRHLLDPLLNGDTRLFIDPILLSASKNSVIQNAGLKQFTEHFGNVIRLLKVSKAPGDLPWRNAEKILTLNELPELCLGYGGNSTRGRRLAKETRQKVLRTAKEIVDLGVEDPELFSLIGLLEEGVGPDTIGDMTANAIVRALVEITADASKQLGVKTTQLRVYEDAARTFESILLIIDVGGLVPKLKTILKQKNKKAGEKKRTPDIVVVDAKIKPSASKRK